MVRLIDSVPLVAFFPLTVVLIVLCMEIGFRMGRWRNRRAKLEADGPVGAMVGAMLALLGFLLAFTFGLAATQFEARRYAVVSEANAVGTAYLRATMLAEPSSTTIRALLRDYVDARETSIVENRVHEGVKQSEAIQLQLWSEARSAALIDPQMVPTGLFIQALNEVIDEHTLRLSAGLYARVPGVVWLTLIVLTAVSMGAVGYNTGIGERARSWTGLGLALAFATVIYLVADLDRPLEGTMQTQRWAIESLMRTMDEMTPRTP